MAIVKVGSNTIDVTLGVVAVNGYGGHRDTAAGNDAPPLKVNPNWVKDPRGHYAKQLTEVEEASGPPTGKDGWVHQPSVAKWAMKPWGVNTDLVEPRRAPYLGVTHANRDLLLPVVGRPEVAATNAARLDVVYGCSSWYVGSTWSGDNAESPRAICPRHMADLAILQRGGSEVATPRRICFDQGAAVLDGYENEIVFRDLAQAMATRGVEAMVEALPSSPADLAWIGAMARYAFLTGRGVMQTKRGPDGREVIPQYRVAKGARLVVLFDGKVVREERGAILAEDVQRVVEWGACFGLPGYGAKSLELLIGGGGHAKAVVEWAHQHGVL